ncbi:MAG: class I SAM-dependent methyltransferase [Candidatus Rifleibacteriota bacterium]
MNNSLNASNYENDYVIHYTSELNPARIQLMLAFSGKGVTSHFENACELGYGYGLSTLIHAAGGCTHWMGTDFNQSQAFYAQQIASQTGIQATFMPESFSEFCSRTDLPDFEYIALHGVWSWISDNDRQIIVDFLKRKLKPGGVAYLGYNSLPGHSQMLPYRELMHSYATRALGEGLTRNEKTRLSLEFIKSFINRNPLLGQVFPLARQTIQDFPSDSEAYLAHEYLIGNWKPMSFSEVHQLLSGALLSFSGTAIPSQNFNKHFLTDEQQKVLAEIPDQVTRETARDIMVNRRFRQDYWVKGGITLSQSEIDELINQTRVILLRNSLQTARAVKQAALFSELPEEPVAAILEFLKDFKPASIDETFTATSAFFSSRSDFLKTIMILEGNFSIGIVQKPEVIERAKKTAHRYNRLILEKAMTSNNNFYYLCSPVTGGGLAVMPEHARLLHTAAVSGFDKTVWAEKMWQWYKKNGIVFVQDGSPINDENTSLTILKEQIEEFSANFLSAYQGLGIL